MLEPANIDQTEPADLYFRPTAADGDATSHWDRTIPGAGWFVCFRICGPKASGFDDTWRVPDFQPA